ncbi:MAG: hypothetical protein ACYCSI_10535 [Solirubrobacteraceae bacterium]
MPDAGSATSTQSRGSVGGAQRSARHTSVAWLPDGDLSVAEWSRVGQRLGAVNRCSAWWIADWIRYGNAKFGEKYSRAARITGYDVQTLMNMVYVASRFGRISRRRENLSWSHHEVVASLEPTEQDRWLDQAVEHKMSVADLRLELRTRSGRQRPASDVELSEGAAGSDVGESHVDCPNCGHSIPHSLLVAQLKDFLTLAENKRAGHGLSARRRQGRARTADVRLS